MSMVNIVSLTGFMVSYSFIPSPGDCHFEGVFCGYINTQPLKWVIGEGVSNVPGTGQEDDSRLA